jgi:valyl-tRNA synthetase
VFLPVDAAVIERERTSLDKEIEKTDREIDVIERKLASDGFVRKAPAEVVEGERRRLEELRGSLELASERRATL